MVGFEEPRSALFVILQRQSVPFENASEGTVGGCSHVEALTLAVLATLPFDVSNFEVCPAFILGDCYVAEANISRFAYTQACVYNKCHVVLQFFGGFFPSRILILLNVLHQRPQQLKELHVGEPRSVCVRVFRLRLFGELWKLFDFVSAQCLVQRDVDGVFVLVESLLRSLWVLLEQFPAHGIPHA